MIILFTSNHIIVIDSANFGAINCQQARRPFSLRLIFGSMIFMPKLFIFLNLSEKSHACHVQEVKFPRKIINNTFQVTYLLLS